MRRALLFTSITAVHCLITILLLAYTFGAGMSRFDTGVPASARERIAATLLEVCGFPLLTVLFGMTPQSWFSGLFGYLPFLANSALWAYVILAVRRAIQAWNNPRS